jgi:phage-related baseplate assembly protein
MLPNATGRYPVIDPARLGRMLVLEDIDTDAIIQTRMARLKEIWATHDPPAAAQYDVEGLEFDPILINQECCTYFELLLRDRVNQAARSLTLANAVGTDLEAIATRYPGGVPRVGGESDTRYRQRVWLSPNPLSPHGTAEGYQFWALSALPNVRDVTTIKIRPRLDDNPIILITCMMSGENPLPTPAELIQIRRYLIAESRLAMTDVISVGGPKVVDLDYRIKVWLYPTVDETSTFAEIKNNLAALIEEQRWLGRDHTRAAIAAAAMLAGVQNVEIVSPAQDVAVPDDWLGRVGSVSVEYAGRRQ